MKSRKTRSRLDLVKRFYITNGLFENVSNQYLETLQFGDNETEPTHFDYRFLDFEFLRYMNKFVDSTTDKQTYNFTKLLGG